MSIDPAFLDTVAVGFVWWALGAASAVAARKLWAARHRTAATDAF